MQEEFPEPDRTSVQPNSSADKTGVRRFHGRSVFVCCFVFLGWAVLLARLIQLQGAQRVLMNDRVARQSTFSETIAARPGEILDRNGHVLAMTVTRDSLYAIPDAIADKHQFAWQVSSVLNLNTDEVLRKLEENAERQFVWIRRRMTEKQLQDFRALNLPRETWGLRREYQRQYPQGSYAAHVLGIRDIDNAGRGGLEESLHDVIRGQDGSRVMTRDARGIIIEVAAERSVAPVHGRTVMSTLDLPMQMETERQLQLLVDKWKPVGACAVVMDPLTGEILAMASRPTFDPNQLEEAKENTWNNLAVSAVFEPGSTFKPFVVGWALQHHQITRSDVIHCGYGQHRMGRRILHDHHSYGELSVEDVLVKSSNVGMAKIAEKMGLEELYRCTVAFGFGRRTGIELPGELPGMLHPLKKWTDYSLGSVPMGQELAVTPLQLITAHAALANGGRLLRPSLLKDASNETSGGALLTSVTTAPRSATVESSILDGDVCEWIVEHPLKQVVERGTGKSAKIKGMSLFGKTGTAQKLDPETGLYSDRAWVVSFLCGAPAESPKALVLVMVDEPTAKGVHYGGTVAAPCASAILRYAMQRTSAE
jgi:cell division protein FtsI (penicillin-binding protein 3)